MNSIKCMPILDCNAGTSLKLYIQIMQHTISRPAQVIGVGLHSGKYTTLTILPAHQDVGIRIFSDNSLDHEKILALDGISDPSMYNDLLSMSVGISLSSISEQFSLSTSVNHPDKAFSVQTIEHLMASLWFCGIDNALLISSGDEIPILDGSSAEFIYAIENAGIKAIGAPRKKRILDREIYVEDGDKYIRAVPIDLSVEHGYIDYSIDFANSGIGKQAIKLPLTRDVLKHGISSARTFGMIADLEQLRRNNMALGASLENVIAFDTNGSVLNEDGLRFHDEPVRHKVLDLIGDVMAVDCGYDPHYNVIANKAGHKLHNLFLKEILSF